MIEIGDDMSYETKEKTAYEKAIDEIAGLTAKVERWKPALEAVEKVKAAFPDLSITASCGLQVGQIQGALIHLNDLERMSDAARVAKMLTALGYHTKGFDDFAELKRRTYDYGDIKLLCFLSYKEGTKCRYVEIGKEEKPIYKLMCDEDDEAVQP